MKIAFERDNDRRALLCTHSAALIGTAAADCLLDQIKRGDAFEYFTRDWRGTSFRDVEELLAYRGATAVTKPCAYGV